MTTTMQGKVNVANKAKQGNDAPTIPALPEIHGTVIEHFKNVIFLTQEYSPKERRLVYVVRLIFGDLHRVRYCREEDPGCFFAEREARAMFRRVVEWVQGGDLYNILSEGPDSLDHRCESWFDL